MAFPEELVQQFRTVALQRLDRVETAWSAVQSTLDDEAATLIHREIHTLKGESRMLGFADVNLVCHKLEDLLEVARARGYAVDDDFDLAVNMALRFMAMLVRKKQGAQLQGIDLPGFIRQIDGILGEIRPQKTQRQTTGAMQPLRAHAPVRVAAPLRARLAPAAADAFIEYAAARGARRDRLRTSWHNLRDLIGIQRAMFSAGQLGKLKSGAVALARDLGKQVDVALEIDSTEITTEMLAAIDTAALHLVRNAIDHGIEAPSDRAAAGKPPSGRLIVRCRAHDQELRVEISDDGRGVELTKVRARAVELGLIAPTVADIRERWFDLVCTPGFSTRAVASDVSGRGVGLDAVRAAVTDLGGALTATTGDGRGTTWRIALPLPKLSVQGHALRVASVPFPIVIDDSWQVAAETAGAHELDIARWLGFSDEPTKLPWRYFARNSQVIAIAADRAPTAVVGRRLISAPPPSVVEVVTLDTVEAVLLHPERAVKPRTS